MADIPLNFIQEDKLDDPQFWVVLPKPLAAGEKYTITTTYDGKDAVTNEGGGNYFPIAREDWYPNAAAGDFGEYTNYDLTFRIPKGMKMAATGNLVSDSNEGDHNVTVWKSEVPTGRRRLQLWPFKMCEDQAGQAGDAGAVVCERRSSSLGAEPANPPPKVTRDWNDARDDEPWRQRTKSHWRSAGQHEHSDLSKKALGEAELSVRIYTDFFGPIAYKRLEITQQTATNFGQSWPGLVYLPMTYLFDTTTRHALSNIMRQSLSRRIPMIPSGTTRSSRRTR